MGAFADRHVIYQLTADHATFSVTSGTPVVFVLVPSSGIEFTTPAGIDADIHNLRRVLGARILVSSPNATVLQWTPPPGVSRVTLPGAATS
jgi:hypothetical protein